MSLFMPDEVRARIEVRIDDDPVLQDIMDEEEDWLAHELRGPLTEERTESFPLAGFGAPRQYEVHLARPTDEVEVEDNGVSVAAENIELRGRGWIVSRRLGKGPFYGPIAVTYTPTDELRVRSAFIQLLGLRLAQLENASGFSSELMGSYQYQLQTGATVRKRNSILRSLREPARPGTVRVRGVLAEVPPVTTVRG